MPTPTAIVVVPRERFSFARESLDSIYRTRRGFELIELAWKK